MSSVPLVLVLAFVGFIAFIAITRRGRNLLSAFPLLPKEVVLVEGDLELTHRDRQSALIVTQVYMAGWARLTSARLLLTQPALGTGSPVVRYVLHRRLGATDPTGWADGVTTFVVDPEKSGPDETGALRLVPLNEPLNLPLWVAVRGDPTTVAAIAAWLHEPAE